jgi:DNA-nicking Smr family endonuclease
MSSIRLRRLLRRHGVPRRVLREARRSHIALSLALAQVDLHGARRRQVREALQELDEGEPRELRARRMTWLLRLREMDRSYQE